MALLNGAGDWLLANTSAGQTGSKAGDSNGDGVFNSSDLVQVFITGEYDDGIPNNSTFEDGDWNHDGDFDSRGLVLAFQESEYVAAASPLDSQIAAALVAIFAEEQEDVDRTKRPAFVA